MRHLIAILVLMSMTYTANAMSLMAGAHQIQPGTVLKLQKDINDSHTDFNNWKTYGYQVATCKLQTDDKILVAGTEFIIEDVRLNKGTVTFLLSGTDSLNTLSCHARECLGETRSQCTDLVPSVGQVEALLSDTIEFQYID